MHSRFLKKILGVLLFSILVRSKSWFKSDHGNKNDCFSESKLLKKSLEEAIGYIEKDPKIVSGDLILGVLIAKANLEWILKKLKHYESNEWTEGIEQLVLRCNRISESQPYTNVSIITKISWVSAAGDLKFGILKDEDDFLLPQFNSCQSIDDYMMNGAPNDSDFCIEELINSGCGVSQECWLSEVNEGPHSGYKTSHRLLYFQVADRMKCNQINPEKFSGIKLIKQKLCQQMLSEARFLSTEPHFHLTQDLFMEQIALCGLEGYEEFAPKIWRNRVINWQSPDGCFGENVNPEKCSVLFKKNIIKRTNSTVGDCHSHVTAVAVSALAYFMRVILNVAFNLY